MSNPVPETYEQWRHCIEVDCGLELTADFIDERLEALRNSRDHHTNRFLAIWGQQHHSCVVQWFQRAQAELSVAQGGAS